MELPAMVAATEIAEMLGVSRQRVQQLAQTPEFPEPALRFKMGNAWLLEDIQRWAAATGRELRP